MDWRAVLGACLVGWVGSPELARRWVPVAGCRVVSVEVRTAMETSTDRLALLYRVSQSFCSSLDLDQVLRTVMDEVITATRAERGFVMLRDANGELAFRVARGMEQRTIASPEFQVSRGVVERVSSDGRPLLTSNAQADEWLGGRSSVVTLGLRSIMCVPLTAKDALLGVIYVDNRLQAGLFTPADLELLSAIGGSAAIAIENARLYEVAVEKGRMERELQVAHDVQASLLPRSTPVVAGWQTAALWLPARQVAGDFYDFLPAARRISFFVGDVCGKGIPAALFMALTRTILRASLSNVASPAHGMEKANRLICADSSDGTFVTLVYGQIELLTGEMLLINAGHNRPLIYRREPDSIAEPEQRSMALGIESSLRFPLQRTALAPGEFVLLYTDGATDAANSAGEQFGAERLHDVVLADRHGPAEQIVAGIGSALRGFIGDAPQYDDITLVAIRREATAG
jgi:phosphoserine phosphatase RsbU/P